VKKSEKIINVFRESFINAMFFTIKIPFTGKGLIVLKATNELIDDLTRKAER
jgi:hypothetical protein